MLYNGEHVGAGGPGPEVDVAVYPLEGTRLAGSPANAIAVIAASERGSMFFPGGAFYMEKNRRRADAIGAVDITPRRRENVNRRRQGEGAPRDRHPRRRARARTPRAADR